MAYTTYVTNDYYNWTRSGSWINTGSSIELLAAGPGRLQQTANAHRHFTLSRAANVADITVYGIRVQGDFDTPGYSYQKVTLISPSASSHILYEDTDDFGPAYLLDHVDITSYLNEAGEYTLEFEARVTVSWFYDSGYFYDESYAFFMDVLLRADADVTVDLILDTETTTPTDVLEVFKYNVDFVESITPKESFQIEKFSPPVSQAAIILCGTTSITSKIPVPDIGAFEYQSGGGHVVSRFTTGTLTGYFDTPEVDFSTPGMEKTLDGIQFEAQTLTPHVVLVYVSLNGGLTWTLVGQDTVYAGKKGFVHPWLTAESFIVRFYGTALYLFSYGLFAIPSGPQIRKS